MKYKDIVEWQTIHDQTFDVPKCSGNNIGNIYTNEGKWDVHVIDDNITHQKIFCVKDQKSDDTVCFIGIELWQHPYAMVKNALTVEKFKKRGIATALLDYIVKNNGYKLFSDFLMTNNGAALWKSILNKSKSRVKIADLKTGEIFTMGEIGTTNSKGEIITNPEFDTRNKPKDLGNIQSNEQQFVFILEYQEIKQKYTKPATRFGGPIIVNESEGILQKMYDCYYCVGLD